jgi:hypothetical protein
VYRQNDDLVAALGATEQLKLLFDALLRIGQPDMSRCSLDAGSEHGFQLDNRRVRSSSVRNGGVSTFDGVRPEGQFASTIR